jgi:type 1 fimbria pilin
MRAFQFGRYLRRVVVLPLFLIPIQAWAQTCSGPLPVTVNIPAVSVPKSLAVGQSIPGGKASFAIALTCSFNFAPGARWWLKTNPSATMTLVPGYSDVYTMSGMTAGIGFRVRGNNGMVLSPIDYGGTSNSFDLAPATSDPNMLVGSFELVKTAETVATGNFSFSTYASVDAVKWANGGTAATSAISFKYTIAASAVPACTVTQSDIAVFLPTVRAKDLATVGATAGLQTFTIDLTCEDNVKPQMSVADVANPSNESTELSLAPGSTATGVAVQVLYGATLIRYAPSGYSYTGAATPGTNGFSFTAGSGAVHVPFSVRYVRVGTPVTPGLVKAMATFSLSYQ